MDGRPNRRNKAPFSNFSSLKFVLEKLRFHDGLVWTGDLTVEIKVRFQISPGSIVIDDSGPEIHVICSVM